MSSDSDNNQKKTILITGAGGALAQEVISRLKSDYEIIAVDFRRRVRIDEGIQSYRVDFNNRAFEDIFRSHEIDGVIHLGRMGLFESDHTNRYTTNVLGTQKLLDLCCKYKVGQVIVMSTYFVYGASPYNPSLLTEDYPLKASELTMDLVDAVELENLANIYLWKYPNLHVTILRPCNVGGPGVLNSMSLLLSRKSAPVLMGFSPMMQFVHVEDMADGVVLAFKQNKPGVYNVAPEDWVAYQKALRECGCRLIHVPSIPQRLAHKIMKTWGLKAFPSYLINYYKYPVILDGALFRDTFGWKPKRSLDELFSYYREKKELEVL
ncbi:MAG: SDR family oxidoreductase [Pseudomonadales bacterium]|nr:SDR family oxidoreductase [Pseudomonadales bacterium]